MENVLSKYSGHIPTDSSTNDKQSLYQHDISFALSKLVLCILVNWQYLYSTKQDLLLSGLREIIEAQATNRLTHGFQRHTWHVYVLHVHVNLHI